MKRLLFALAATLVLAPSLAAAQTVILVRHAEKADASADPDLSEAGRARALILSTLLADAGVTRVYTTPLARTRQTAEPTAAAAGVEIATVALDGGAAAHVARVAETVRAAGPDDVVLVVGHSNTVAEIARALGDPSPEALTDCDYDRILVLDLDGGRTRAVHGRYGARSEAC